MTRHTSPGSQAGSPHRREVSTPHHRESETLHDGERSAARSELTVDLSGPALAPGRIEQDDLTRLASDLEGGDSLHYVRRFKHEFDPPSPFRHGGELSNIAIVLTAEGWGAADTKLSQTLLNDFLITLVERAQKPRYVLLVNSAVKLAAQEGDALDNLKKLEALGVKIQLNMTSLFHFKLEKEMRVGEVITMMDIVSTLHDVEKVITF